MSKRILLVVALCSATAALAQGGDAWKIHDAQRPNPPKVTPGAPGMPPSDAIILFDGTDLAEWEHEEGSPAGWKVENGYMEANASGNLFTKDSFGDCQLHVEWAASEGGVSQDGGNSGVIFMGKYEVQVLNSYDNRTYADGQAASVYAQYPPLVNVSLPPRQWQTFDIVFRAPRLKADGSVLRPAFLTVFHNGVLVQDHVRLSGTTGWMSRKPYENHPNKLPLKLQYHNNPVRYRNIWIRELGRPQTLNAGPDIPRSEPTVTLTQEQRDAVTGVYFIVGETAVFATVYFEDGKLMATVRDQAPRELLAKSPTEFFFKEVEAPLVLDVDPSGKVTGGTMTVGIDPKVLQKR